MKELNYNEVLKFAKELSKELVDNNLLRSHCKKHNLNYLNVASFIRGERKSKQPKLIKDFLVSLGYTVQVDKQIIYSFILDTDEATNLSIDEILKEEK